MPYERNRLLALLLNLIPGVGHLYWGKKGRGITYPILFFGGLLFGFVVAMAADSGELAMVTLIAAILLWLISMTDLLITMLRESPEERAYREHVRQMTAKEGNRRNSLRFCCRLFRAWAIFSWA